MARVSKKLLKNGLTPKQDGFKNSIIKQILEEGKINATQAALENYDVKDNNNANVIAQDNLRIPTITNEIEKTLKKKGYNIENISDNLGYIANHRPEKINADAVIRANEVFLKLLGYGNRNTQVSLSFKADLGKLSYKEVQNKLSEVDQELKEVMEGEVL